MSLHTDTSLRFSIVVVEIAGGESLVACLSVVQQFGIECIAVLRESSVYLSSQFEAVEFLILDQPVPFRRQQGALLATGDIVVLIEDTTIPDASLLNGLAGTFKDNKTLAASGPVAISECLSARYQALACTEYGRYHSGVLFNRRSQEALSVKRLPGNFICYRRDALMAILEHSNDGLVEGQINQRLLSEGATLIMEPKLANTYCGEDQWGGRLSTRFHHGWLYAGSVAQHKRLFGRVVQCIKALLLPVVLSLRAIRCLSKMNDIKHPLKVGLWICLLEICWSAGEIVGSVVGAPKNMEHWR